MPKKEHAALKKRADQLGLKGKERDAYIYGTMDGKAKKATPAKKGKKESWTKKYVEKVRGGVKKRTELPPASSGKRG